MNSNINFMYFAYNRVNINVIEQIANEVLYMTTHFVDKFKNSKHNNATFAFFDWFMQLSNNNKEPVCNWIEANYNYKG